MSARLIDGKTIAANLLVQVRERVQRKLAAGIGAPGLAVIMVGDNPARDIAGARAMGMRSVFVARGFRPADPDNPADLSVNSLSEMLPWLTQ